MPALNKDLLEALKGGDKGQIIQLLVESGVSDSSIADMLSDTDTSKAIANSIQVVCGYIMDSIGVVNKSDPTWNTYFNTARLRVGLEELQENPATPVFVQAMMLVTYALLNGDG